MKKKSSSKSGFINTRNLLGVFLCLSGISLAMLSFAAPPTNRKAAVQKSTAKSPTKAGPVRPNAPTVTPAPAAGTLTRTNIGTANALNYADTVGSATNDTFFAGSGTCAVPGSCSTFTLTIDSTVGTGAAGYDPTKYSIFIEILWPHPAEDYDTWICSTAGNCVQANVIASNTSVADPEIITLPTNIAPGAYTINAVMATGAFEPYTGTVYLSPLQGLSGNCVPPTSPACAPPRYFNYPAGPAQANNAGEPSIGVDWNPNVPSLKDTTSNIFTTGTKRLNTGGVAFFTSGSNEWRANFDDCPSPAINIWQDVSATTTQTFVLSDPIGFVDHYSSAQLGLVYPPLLTPGRVFTIDLIGGQGDSLGSFSDTDGNSYLPGGNGGAPAGPDHETLGGGPYNPNSTPPPPPQGVAYGSPSAIYYCSQNIVGEAECSRSDNGGQTFGPGVPIFNPAVCTGALHGHVKVAPDGTVYVPNTQCGTTSGGFPAGVGAAVSRDNGLTWNEFNAPNSTGSQDPSIGIGQNNVGRPAPSATVTSNTLYLGWIDGNNHPHAADSHDRGVTWEHDTDIALLITDPVTGALVVTHGVFPVVVAGDDNRAAFGFLGTGDAIGCADPYGAALTCQNIWHLYIATTYDGGAHWIVVDATPNDPVQVGAVCLQGTLCADPPRNLLDFNDFSVDAQGRGVLGYADGCVNCTNSQTSQSGSKHGTIARQSGGRRLFSFFDPIEPMPPAAPQLVSAFLQASPTGALVTWLQPDNGGSPITGYNVYRSATSNNETFLAPVSGATTNKYLDQSPFSPNSFYYVQAVNGIGEGTHCGEVSLAAAPENYCFPPGVTVTTDPAGDEVAAQAGTPPQQDLDVQKLQISEPFTTASDNSVTFTLKTASLASPLPPNATWFIRFNALDTNGASRAIFVEMDTLGSDPTVPVFHIGRSDATTGDTTQTPNLDADISGSFTADGTIIIKLKTQTAMTMTALNLPAFTVTLAPGAILSTVQIQSAVLVGPPGVGGLNVFTDGVANNGGVQTYTLKGNQSCKPDTVPIPILAGSPLTGKAPLLVNFDGSGSSDPDGDTIASYTLDFGDGTAPVTQASPLFSHTYNSNGDFPARLTVTDSRGKASLTSSQLVISVTSTFNQAVSHKVHALAGPFDIDLPLTGVPGNECRSGGANNDYTIIYTFDRALSSAGTATVSHGVGGGTGSVSSQTFGPNANQYTVNLTNVSNAQHLSVTLNGVQDSAGALINNSIARADVLVGDVNASGRVDSTDVFQVRQNTLQNANSSNFRTDVDTSGRIDSTDVFITRQQTLTSLP